MTPAVTALPLRSSPTARNIFQKSLRLAAAQKTRALSLSTLDPMLARSNKKFEATAGPKRNPLEKQLFPSSSPSAANVDIREQLKKPAARPGIASASARISQPPSSPLNNRSVNMSSQFQSRNSTGPVRGPLASLYGHSDSFKQEPSIIDLTGPESIARAKEAVFFAEDDFSDDEDLDLDYEAPLALPSLPSVVKPTITKQSMPPPPHPPSTQPEVSIPWSSSPAAHFLPPKAQRMASAGSGTPEKSDRTMKRESSGESGSFDLPVPKKAKRRVLPAIFRQDDPEDYEDDHPITRTPMNKRKDLWDPTASAVREQKKQFRNQQQTSEPQNNLSVEEMQHISTSTSKSFAVTLSEEQKHVLNLVVNKNQSVFFTGPAGTGKSVLMRAIISDLKKKYAKDPERVAVTASTGLAACNIGGITLHSFSGIGLGKEDATTLVKKIRRNAKAKNRWLRTKCLIIDEVSMVDGDLFDKLSQIGRTIRNDGRPWGGIQLIITGDFFQLPPVPDSSKRESKFAFDAATWSTSIDHTIGLTQVFRQRDPQFANMLNEIRLGKISEGTVRAFKALQRPLRFDDGVGMAELFSTRAEVENSNVRQLKGLPGKTYRYDAMDTGDPAVRDKLLMNMMAPKSIDLKVNAQVMLIKNLDETLVNGSLGKVIAFSDEKSYEMSMGGDDFGDDPSMAKAKRKLQAFSRDPELTSSDQKFPVVQFIATDGTSRNIICQPEDWKVELPNGEVQAKRSQLPLILAWALSIHKAQGQTLERVKVNLGRVFEKGQAYVALSRATCQEGLEVWGFDKHRVMAHPRVVAFYGKLYSAEEATKKKPASVSVSDFISNRKGAPAAPAKKVTQVIDLDDDEEAMASYGY